MLRRLSLTALLVVFCALTLSKTFADEVPENSYSKYLPANTMFFMETLDIVKTNERLAQMPLFRMFEDEQIVAFIDALKAIAGGRDLVEVEETAAKVKEYIEKASTIFKGHAFLSVSTLAEENPEIGAMLGVEVVEGKMNEAIELLNSLVDLLKQQPKMEQLVFETEDFEGVTLNIGTFAPRIPQVVWAVTDKVFLFGIGKSAITNFITAQKVVPNESLYNNPEFIRAHNLTRCSEMYWYYDYRAFCHTVKNLMAAMPPTPFDMTLMFDKLAETFSKCSHGTSVIDGDLIDEMVVLFGDGPKLKMIERESTMKCKYASAKMMPMNPLIYACQNISFDGLYDDIYQFLPVAAQETIAMYENQFMFSLRDELIPALGEEVGFCFDMQIVMPDGMFAIEVKDQATLTNIIDMLRANLGVNMNEFDYKGVKISSTNIDRFQIGYTFYENFLLVGTMNAIKSAIGREGETVADNPFFQQMIALGEQKAGSGMFIDLRKGFEMLYSLGMPFAMQYLAANPEFDPTVVPPMEVFTQYITPIVMASFYQDNAAISRMKGPFPIGAFMGFCMAGTSIFMQYVTIEGPGALAGGLPGDIF